MTQRLSGDTQRNAEEKVGFGATGGVILSCSAAQSGHQAALSLGCEES